MIWNRDCDGLSIKAFTLSPFHISEFHPAESLALFYVVVCVILCFAPCFFLVGFLQLEEINTRLLHKH